MFTRRGTRLQGLSKLYSDAKQSYENTRVSPAVTTITESPELKELRLGFQIQQDRLLAWGLHWADNGPADSKHADVDIDKKINEAGLGDVVSSVITEIQQITDEIRGMGDPGRRSEKNLASLKDPEWTVHEIRSRKALLSRLTGCLDLLYELEESRAADEKGDAKRQKYAHQSSEATANTDVYDHPLHIDFGSLEFNDYTLRAADPPPYDPSKGVASSKERSTAYYRAASQFVLVDYLPADTPSYVIGSADDVFEVHELGEELCKDISLSWCGHLRLLGFTINPAGPRCAMVYALPEGHDHQSLQQHRTLSSLITATSSDLGQDAVQPPLEDRFRLAYNLALSIMGYFAHGETHQHINGSNFLVLGSSEHHHRTKSPKEMRSPYLLQSCQDFLSKSETPESFATHIYRHPEHDARGSEVVPAYDIYSLGLLLLEIGLWMPLSRFWKPKYTRTTFMDRTRKVYSPKLASKCGSRYMRVVKRCLEAPAELQFRNNYEDAGSFLLQVLKDLQQCCALDEDPPPPLDIETFELLLIGQMYKAETKADEEKAKAESTDFEVKPPLPKRALSKRKLDAVQQPPDQVETSLRKWPQVDIPQEDLDQWNTALMPKLGRILQNALKDCPESCSLSLMMFGSTPEKARTTICVQCPHVNKVRDILRQGFRLKKGWGLVLLNGEVKRSGKRRRINRWGYNSGRQNTKAVARRPREQKFQQCPSNGASIGAYRGNEHLPPVSFGGTILVDGDPYGMTVHHMLDVPSDDEEEDDEPIIDEQPRRSAGGRTMLGPFDTFDDIDHMHSQDDISRFPDLEISDDEFDGSDDESQASTIRPDYSIMDADGNEFWFLDDSTPELDDDEGSDDDDASSSSSDDVDDVASIGDRVGVDPYSDDDFYVTQPAIDDVEEDFFPNDEDRDDDHLASHSFGYVFASSGIRRVIRGEMKHEVDWALIKVHPERLKVDNAMTATSSTSVKAGPKGASTGTANQQPMLTKIMPLAKLSGLQVHCRGRSSGFKKGRISQAMALVKMHGRQSFSISWCVEGGIGVPGDSGAWVYDPISGGLCGHVLAWSERSKTAYIAPMEVLFEDIRARLGAQCVELPVPSAVSMRGGAGAGPEKDAKGTVVETGTAACKGDGGDDIAEKLSRLKIEKEATMRTLVMAGPVS
ncbi:hypothetical protein LTR99_005065 [Exophiala xenobiotica]|uniref:DUF7580 domain-containing protein n=1 Tax=Vermiconidia calcicola TaxID=1690605 RepID=A0AAV9QJ11_9PEZI|nr:hypothetical protein LTR72_002925 [Exophiala xenobiotica]KAK5536468.1 hypothetical protein LTR23_007903 [Chaetothyriales sp. CCFEE 6169]KAK5541454.1 hypothetical protein LTR25_003232 [Vermiconidia calcicola]KAK5270622.1 hypothetical protein LTR96_003899 [Exophiala xenobiotica]KAK5300686.1 hypothetical protein LTR14_001083 [Exophiala xenobiotica]